MITPTPGRIVWYRPLTTEGLACQPGKPLAAIVADVITDRCVTLSVIDAAGNHHGRTAIPLLQDDDAPLERGGYAEWMPYQVGQAKRHEADNRENRSVA